MHYQTELRKLSVRTRNQVRALLSATTEDAVPRLNDLRAKCSAGELVKIDRVLHSRRESDPLIPTPFPVNPQTTEDFYRLRRLSFPTQLRVLELNCREHQQRLVSAINSARTLDRALVDLDINAAASLIENFKEDFGYSHFLLRKVAFARTIKQDAPTSLEELLSDAGLARNNIIVTSLSNCYQEEQDFLSLKRSIMNLQDRGPANRFTRDLCRVPYHPFAADQDELTEIVQSCMQSSLIDALIACKVNRDLLPEALDLPTIRTLFEQIESDQVTIDEIASVYDASDEESEHSFYKRSSAWLELDDVVKYRTLQDHFYEYPEASLSRITSRSISRVENWVRKGTLDDLGDLESPTIHQYPHVKHLEVIGTVTRSAVFNYRIYEAQGYTGIQEDNLVRLMDRTRDLARTIHPEFGKNLASATGSTFSKLVLYLLIAKKSRNEKDDHRLRRVLQEIVQTQFGSDLIKFFDSLGTRSDAIARYAYDVFTEDFIAKLFYLVQGTSEITETRANIHRWMGQYTGEKAYLDRARTLIIDHQINKVRNEIDDHRIYVDAARFKEWLDDEVMSELTSLLSGIEHNSDLVEGSLELILGLLERCYTAFCSNKVFGIASYLGRRIRHGTFKGHLFTSVVRIEKEEKYERLMWDYMMVDTWTSWKYWYEHRVDEIIRERLHVSSPTKKDGLLKPSLSPQAKTDIGTACARALAREFSDSKSAANLHQLIAEYCWRLAEVDLRSFNSFLKNQRRTLLSPDHLHLLRTAGSADANAQAHEFCRELVRTVDEKFLVMYTWFKRPLSVAPQASLTLLFRAVVEEVRESFPEVNAEVDFDPEQDVELLGGIYHILYDAFYVVVYNAAKHGRNGGPIRRKFSIGTEQSTGRPVVVVEISSELTEGQSEEQVREKLIAHSDSDIENAHLYEHRSGIPKLYQLESMDKSFRVLQIACEGRQVLIKIAYLLER